MFRRRTEKDIEAQLVEAWINNFFVKKRNSNLEEAARQIIKAINDKGRVAKYHDHVERKHREEWPALWKAIDNLVLMYKQDDEQN
jgi:hypothetical protein